MKKLLTIFLSMSMLIPLFWNSVSIIHYLVEHTHTFCANEENHQHTSADDCHTVCQISPLQEQSPVPYKIEFYDLKQCISECSIFNRQFSFSNATSINSDYVVLFGRMLSKDIFRPPIS